MSLAQCQAVRTVKTPTFPPSDDDYDFAPEPTFEPTPVDAEWYAAWSLAAHVQPAGFEGWLRAIARQHRMLAAAESVGPWYAWLARQVEQLADTARLLHAGDPDTFDERRDAMEYARRQSA